VGSAARPPAYGGTPSGQGYGAGAAPSGGFPAAGGNRPGGDNRTLWIVVGVVAVIAVILIGIAVSQGGGDESGSGTEGGGGSATTTAGDDTDTTGASGIGYDDPAFEEGFIGGCTGDGSGMSEAQCQCAYDELEATVPFDTVVEWSTQMNDDPTNVPDDLLTIMSGCMNET
jgi:hypothetical protein